MNQDARHSFGFRLVSLARQWRRQLDHELARAGLTDASWTPLIHLAESGDGVSQSELAERVGLDGSSLVRLIDLLEGRGMIERRVDQADRRARRIFLTGTGRKEVRDLRKRLYQIESALLRDVDDRAILQSLGAFRCIEERIAARRTTEGTIS